MQSHGAISPARVHRGPNPRWSRANVLSGYSLTALARNHSAASSMLATTSSATVPVERVAKPDLPQVIEKTRNPALDLAVGQRSDDRP
jgi:hypothetical protein